MQAAAFQLDEFTETQHRTGEDHGKRQKASKRVATTASGILRSPTASKAAKTVAASALAQAGTAKSTSKRVATVAAKALNDGRTKAATKKVAASTLTQKLRRKP